MRIGDNGSEKFDSILVNSTAFSSSGVLFVHFSNHGLKIYRFHFKELIEIAHSKRVCNLTLSAQSVSTSWNTSITFTVVHRQSYVISVLIIYGIWLCIVGMLSIIALTRHYMLKK